MFDLSGNVAVVTGASAGLGRQFALALARQGADLAILARRKEKLDAVAEEIKALGVRCLSVACDVTDTAQIENAVKEVVAEYGTVDILVNNAGIRQDNIMVFMLNEQWHNVLDTTLNGFFYITRRLLKGMMTRRDGRIINMASLSGIKGMPGQVNYSAAKGAVIAATKALAQEVAPRKVTVNAVAPGFIESDMTADLPVAELKKMVPLKRFGRPEEVAALVSFLASDAAAYITGETISINGGLYS